MKTITLLFCSLLSAICAAGQASTKYPLVTFEALGKTASDTVRLKAYVLDVYQCPPCPPGMICKPCMENHFTVVEKKPADIMKIPLEDRVRIFTDQPKALKIGKPYTFTVRFRNKKASPKDNLELISYTPR
jgi:hypothetical protein